MNIPLVSKRTICYTGAMKLEDKIAFWESSGKRSWEVSQSLFKLKHYDSCLFFCHLAIEKLLKGLVIRKTRKDAPYIHDLERLATLSEITYSDEQKEHLREIVTFNIAGRYDDEKRSFYKKCTPSYTKKYLEITRKLVLWLEDEYRNN